MDVAEPINRWLQYLWVALWTVINPLIMAVIVIGSIIMESLEPLTYTLFRNVRPHSVKCIWRIGVDIMVSAENRCLGIDVKLSAKNR